MTIGSKISKSRKQKFLGKRQSGKVNWTVTEKYRVLDAEGHTVAATLDYQSALPHVPEGGFIVKSGETIVYTKLRRKARAKVRKKRYKSFYTESGDAI